MIDYNVLGNVIDSTWGKSSTTPNSASQSVKMTLKGQNGLEVHFVAIVNFVSEQEMFDLKKKFSQEADAIINESLKKVKKDYKEETDETIKFKEVKSDEKLEFMSMNIYNGKRTAYYVRTMIFEMS